MFFSQLSCPSLLRIFLRILESNLLASRSHWMHRLVERIVIPPNSGTNAGNRASTTTSSGSPTVASTNSGSPTHFPNIPFRPSPGSSSANGSDLLADAQSGNSQSTGTTLSDEECERLCSTMLLTQNATVVHLLLEHCLPTQEERVSLFTYML